MPQFADPFWLIVGLIALACVALYPLRIWRRNHHRYGTAGEGDESDDER
jgi:hypothetical protein